MNPFWDDERDIVALSESPDSKIPLLRRYSECKKSLYPRYDSHSHVEILFINDIRQRCTVGVNREVLVNDRTECLQNHFGFEHREIEISGHEPMGRLSLFTGDSIRECGCETVKAAPVDIRIDGVVGHTPGSHVPCPHESGNTDRTVSTAFELHIRHYVPKTDTFRDVSI